MNVSMKRAVSVLVLMPLTTLSDPSIPSAEQGMIEEVMVTARKRTESVQAVPTAITALGAEALDDMQIRSFQDVGKTAPNVHVQKQTGEPSAPHFLIRGIAAGSPDFRLDSGVALYLDGVYLGRPSNAAFDLADLERLEVLRGPQGTLFGRNSTGGAISFVSASPTGQKSLLMEATLGNYDKQRGKITINTEEWNGLAARLTYVHDEEDGWAKNSGPRRTFHYDAPHKSKTSAKTYGANDSESVLAAIRYTGIDRLQLDYKGDYTDWKGSVVAMQLLHGGVAFSGLTDFPNQPALGGTQLESLKRQTSLPIDGVTPASQRTWGHNVTAAYELTDSISLKYIGGYRGFLVRSNTDLDGNTLMDPSGNGNEFQAISSSELKKQRQWSHELQMLGTGNGYDWVVGLFHFRERASRNSPLIFGESHPAGGRIELINPDAYVGNALQDFLNNSMAAYAHTSVDLSDRLELGGGVRYSKDRRTEDDLVAAPRADGTPRGRVTMRDERFDYDASLKFALNDRSNLYAKFATGFVSGGVANGNKFDPETIESYELGLKSDWLGGRLRINSALFHAERKNLQVTGFDPNQGGFMLLNAGIERSHGFEIEMTLIPFDKLMLAANYGYTDVDISTDVRSFQPEHTGYLAAQYDLASFGNGSRLQFHIDGHYVGEHYRLQCPIGSTQSATLGCVDLDSADHELDRALTISSSWRVGARLTLSDIPLGNASGRISLWGMNLNDSDEYEFLFQLFDTWVVGSFQQPRTYGIDFRVEF